MSETLATLVDMLRDHGVPLYSGYRRNSQTNQVVVALVLITAIVDNIQIVHNCASSYIYYI